MNMKLKAPDKKVLVIKDAVTKEVAGLKLAESARTKVQRATIKDVGGNGEEWMKEGVTVFLPEVTGVLVHHDNTDYHSVLNNEIYAYLEE